MTKHLLIKIRYKVITVKNNALMKFYTNFWGYCSIKIFTENVQHFAKLE